MPAVSRGNLSLRNETPSLRLIIFGGQIKTKDKVGCEPNYPKIRQRCRYFGNRHQARSDRSEQKTRPSFARSGWRKRTGIARKIALGVTNSEMAAASEGPVPLRMGAHLQGFISKNADWCFMEEHIHFLSSIRCLSRLYQAS